MRIRTPIDLGLAIRARRRGLGLDQRALAAKVGVNRQWVIDLEKGRPGAGMGLVLRALDLLGLSIAIHTEEAAAPPPPGPAAGPPEIDLGQVIRKARGEGP